MSPQSWRLDRMTPLGWLETLLKLVAFIFAGIAIARALPTEQLTIPTGTRLAQFLLLGLLSLGLFIAIFDRIAYREIFAMGFILLNNLAHWGLVYVLAATTSSAMFFIVFCILMLLGDLAKLAAITVEGFAVPRASRRLMLALTGFYSLGYATLLGLELVTP